MKRRLPDSPSKLSLLSVVCIFIVCAFFLIPGSRLVHSPLFGVYLILGILVGSAGFILPLKFVTDLRHGVEDDRWTEAQLEPLRSRVESPYYTALIIGILVAFIVLEFLLNKNSWELQGACFSILEFVLLELRRALKRPTPSTSPN